MDQIKLLKFKSQIKIDLFVFLIFFFVQSKLFTQELYDLSRFIQTGLEQNFSLKVVRNNEQVAQNNYTPGNAGMLPTITSTNRFGGANEIQNNYGSAGIELGMTIFRGFQVQKTYQKLGALAEIGGLNTQMAIENMVAQIVAEYNYYSQQLIQYNNLAYAVSLSRERARIDEQRYLLGNASKLELLQSIVYLNADSSRYARQKEILRTSQIKLNELMASDDLGENIVLKDTLITINENLLFDELLSFTLSNNTGLQIASKNQAISELDYKIIQSRSYPYLTLSTGYGYTFSEMENADIQEAYGLQYGLTLGVDLFDGFNRKRERANARVEIENMNILYSQVEQEIKADLLTVFYAYENNLRLLRLEEQNLEVARENLEIALERYTLGSLAGLELREVQKSLLDAEERLISVKFQTKLAEISLLHISGQIMIYL
jgi:outer membrane protein TolC